MLVEEEYKRKEKTKKKKKKKNVCKEKDIMLCSFLLFFRREGLSARLVWFLRAADIYVYFLLCSRGTCRKGKVF